MVVLDEDQFFELKGNVTSPGYQTIALSGVLTKQIGGETYYAPILPRMFYGADGSQLGASWRQYLPTAGEQVLLSRSGGQPQVGEPDVYWKKLPTRPEVTPTTEEVKPMSLYEQFTAWWNPLPLWQKLAVVALIGAGTIGLYKIYKVWKGLPGERLALA